MGVADDVPQIPAAGSAGSPHPGQSRSGSGIWAPKGTRWPGERWRSMRACHGACSAGVATRRSAIGLRCRKPQERAAGSGVASIVICSGSARHSIIFDFPPDRCQPRSAQASAQAADRLDDEGALCWRDRLAAIRGGRPWRSTGIGGVDGQAGRHEIGRSLEAVEALGGGEHPETVGKRLAGGACLAQYKN